ncbi:MAG: hypothetical protein E5X62_25100 [Mesorhizobium sp.]|nr:MAG: hypothetical protein E5X62_25100 [Mesorhizobium sp.]
MACRLSPPQGGRLAVHAPPLFLQCRQMAKAWQQLISPLEGEMSGRTEGGAVPPAIANQEQIFVRR